MSKRKTKPLEIEMTILIKSKAEFKSLLNNRIDIGKKIIEAKIENGTDFLNAKNEYSDWTDYNMELLKQSFNIPLNEYHRSYKSAGNFHGVRVINTSSRLTLAVHGHDEEAKVKTARFIEKLGFEAIILHEKASSSMTIIEKIENYSDVGFGIVLYTPCDIGGKQIEEPKLNSRARQNVVFEHGFLMGKIGRSNVCALVKGDTETPNDISGVVYVSMDSADAWKYTVAKEMREVGYKIDMNKI